MNDSTICTCGHVAAAHVVEASFIDPTRRYKQCGVSECGCKDFTPTCPQCGEVHYKSGTSLRWCPITYDKIKDSSDDPLIVADYDQIEMRGSKTVPTTCPVCGSTDRAVKFLDSGDTYCLRCEKDVPVTE